MTPERALLAARNSDGVAYSWKAPDPESIAHQFPVEGSWMRSRCLAARWTVDWRGDTTAPRCEACCELSALAVETEARAILAVAASGAVA